MESSEGKPNSPASKLVSILNVDPKEKPIVQPYLYIVREPGKEVRSRLIDAFDRWLNIPKDKLTSVKEIVRELHNASLIIDDIEDNSKLRRGIPVAHSIYGVPLSINAANYVYFLAMRQCLTLGSAECLGIFADELISLHRGQGFDIYWRDNCVCPTEEEYKSMVLGKTGGLFRLSVRLMQAFSENKSDFLPLVNALSLLFQIRDDYINMQSSEYMLNKSFCEDLTEGKFSFPIIHHIINDPEGDELLQILKQRTDSLELKNYAVQSMTKSGSFEYTKRVIDEIKNEIMSEITKLGGNPDLEHSVNDLWPLKPSQ